MAKNNALEHLEQEVAKILFDFCGTSFQPKKTRNAFLSIIDDYKEAQSQEKFIQSIEFFFKENPHVMSIVIDGDEEYDDEGGTVFYTHIGQIEFTPTYVEDTIPMDYKDEEERIRSCLDNDEIETHWVSETLLKNLSPWKLCSDKISSIRAQVQNPRQLKILSAVDNYEKNLIEQSISKLPVPPSGKPKPKKL